MICSTQHQKKVNLWTKNSYRGSVGISAITPAKRFLPDGNHLFFVQKMVRGIFTPKHSVFICGKHRRIVKSYNKLTSDVFRTFQIQ
ncbi:hypothetical protein AW059_25935 [Escherichia coli]|nr:hypothetical protein AW059_25935 [Escherichia coli]